MENSATLEGDLISAERSRRSRRLRTAIRPWLTPKIMTGGFIVFILIVVGLLAPLIAPYDPNAQNLGQALRPPDWLFGSHLLGTDAVGRDILSRLFYGARISLVIAVLVVLISGAAGIVLGAISGYFAGIVDFLIQKLVEVVWAFPPLLLAIAIMAFLGQGLENLILALVSQRWIAYCRVARGQALSLRTREFVDAARSLGATTHAHHPAAYHAEPVPVGRGHRHVLHGVCNHFGGGAQLPWARCATGNPDMGQHARRRAHLHQHVVVAGAVSGSLHLLHRARHQSAW